MAITEKEVHVACFQTLKEGRYPTYKAIRNILGDTGSNQTIGKYLNTWRERLDGDYENPALSDVPRELKNPIQNFWSSAVNTAREITKSEFIELSSEIASLKSNLDYKESKIVKLKNDNHVLEEKNYFFSDTNENLLQTAKSYKEEINRLTEDNKTLISVVNAKKDECVDLKDVVKDLRNELKEKQTELSQQKSFTQKIMEQTASAMEKFANRPDSNVENEGVKSNG